MTDCVVCNTPNCKITSKEQGDSYDCQRCGRFLLTGTVASVLKTYFEEEPLRAAIMSHTLRRSNPSGSRPITTYNLPSYWLAGLPKPQQQADAFILWIGDNQLTPTHRAKSSELALDAWVGAALPRTPGTADGLRWIIGQLRSEHLFDCQQDKGKIWLSLTLDGWKKYAALKQKAVNSRTGFMAMKFGDTVLEGMVRDCFRPAVKRTGFELKLLTDDQPAGLIDDQLRAAILSARFLIADLSHDNPGAYWEAGFADGLGLPVIYSCEVKKWEQSKTHFDTNHMVTVVWDAKEPKIAADKLTAYIRATLRAEAKQTDDISA